MSTFPENRPNSIWHRGHHEMSVINELSCEVAVAVLTRDAGKTEPKELLKMLLEFHLTLVRLSSEARRHRRSDSFSALSKPPSNRAFSANN